MHLSIYLPTHSSIYSFSRGLQTRGASGARGVGGVAPPARVALMEWRLRRTWRRDVFLYLCIHPFIYPLIYFTYSSSCGLQFRGASGARGAGGVAPPAHVKQMEWRLRRA